MNSDAVTAWALSAVVALYILVGLAWGQLPTKAYWVRRNETPGVFWFGIAVAGVALFALVFVALYFTLPPLPDH